MKGKRESETMTRHISFLVDKNEIKLAEKACFWNPEVTKVFKEAKPEDDKFKVNFSYDLLDELVGFIAASANHEKSKYKEDELDKLF